MPTVNELVPLRQVGGEAAVGRDVSAILLEGDRVRGVRHQARDVDEPRADLAPFVFGNAAPTVLAVMLPEQAPKVQRALSGPTPVNFIVDDFAWAQPPFA